MSESDVAVIPAKPDVTMEDLIAWDNAVKALKAAQANEILLRQRIFAYHFPSPAEGTNTFVLPSGYQLKGQHKINRKVIADQLRVLSSRTVNPEDPLTYTPSRLEQAGVNADKVFKWEPDLVLKEYRTLTAEQQQVVDLCLESKPGTPSLNIEPPAKRK